MTVEETTVRTRKRQNDQNGINRPALYLLSKSPSSREKRLFSELILKLELDLDWEDVEGKLGPGKRDHLVSTVPLAASPPLPTYLGLCSVRQPPLYTHGTADEGHL